MVAGGAYAVPVGAMVPPCAEADPDLDVVADGAVVDGPTAGLVSAPLAGWPAAWRGGRCLTAVQASPIGSGGGDVDSRGVGAWRSIQSRRRRFRLRLTTALRT